MSGRETLTAGLLQEGRVNKRKGPLVAVYRMASMVGRRHVAAATRFLFVLPRLLSAGISGALKQLSPAFLLLFRLVLIPCKFHSTSILLWPCETFCSIPA